MMKGWKKARWGSDYRVVNRITCFLALMTGITFAFQRCVDLDENNNEQG